MYNYKIDEIGNIIEEIIGPKRSNYISLTYQIDATKMFYDLVKKEFILKPEPIIEPLIQTQQYVPTLEEKISALNTEYSGIFYNNRQAYVMAQMDNDQGLIDELITERIQLKAKYSKDMGALLDGTSN